MASTTNYVTLTKTNTDNYDYLPVSNTVTLAIPTDNTGYVRVGSLDLTGSANPYKLESGQVDDTLVYSKELSAPEVKRIYNAGKRSHR